MLRALHHHARLQVPVTCLYAAAGLAASPLLVPALILKNVAQLLIFSPFLLLATPVAVPVGFLLASACLSCQVRMLRELHTWPRRTVIVLACNTLPT